MNQRHFFAEGLIRQHGELLLHGADVRNDVAIFGKMFAIFGKKFAL